MIKLSNIKRALFILLVFLMIMLVLFSMGSFWRIFYPLRYEDIIINKSIKYDLEADLIAAVIFVESRFQKRAHSHKGAAGLMQIMPSTGDWIAENLEFENFEEELLYDPEINIEFGCWYLSNLKQEFGSELIVVLAAYNAGRGNVKKWLEEGRDWNYTLDDMPFPETRDYIEKVIKVSDKYRKLYDIG